MTRNLKFDNEMKQLSIGVYNGKEKYIPKDWIKIGQQDSQTGFHGEAFYKNGVIVLAYRGTELSGIQDIISDRQMAFKELPNQYFDAIDFYNKVKSDFQNVRIVFTGHSLGGSLAQLMGNLTGNETVTFNAYGVGNLIPKGGLHNVNIRNYGNINDTVFRINLNNQIGETYIIKKGLHSGFATYDPIYNNYVGGMDLIFHHFLGTMGNLDDSVEYVSPKPLTGGISLEVDARDVDTKRVMTREEIAQMSGEEFEQNEKFINQLLNAGNIMTKAQADEKVFSGELIWVNSYTRDDGTEVRGYYRRK